MKDGTTGILVTSAKQKRTYCAKRNNKSVVGRFLSTQDHSDRTRKETQIFFGKQRKQ